MRRIAALVLFSTIGIPTFAQTPTISYKLGMSQPWTHLFEVEVSFGNLPSERTLELLLPTWRSGRYVIFDFAGSVQEFSARNNRGKSLAWEKIDKTTWQLTTEGEQEVTIQYKVYANEFSLRTKGLNDEGAFLDGTSAFMYVERYRPLPLTLTVVPYKGWHVTTGLEPVGEDTKTFASPNYDHLVDCPFFVGNQKDFEFDAEGKEHVLSILGDGNYDGESIIDDLRQVVKTNKEFWGSLPYEKYIFMVYLSPEKGGGTEHINSTIMVVRPFIFNDPGEYNGFLGLVSHEFFHTWNVKQIRPRGISPYNWKTENYAKELWIAEGATSYYSSLLMVRAGFSTAHGYIDQLPNQIIGDRLRPGNRIQSATEASFDAWIKHWKPTPHAYNSQTDYYDRGADLSLALDLEIRHRSGNKSSLDNVMRALYKRFPPDGPGYTVDDFQKICEEHARSSFQAFFREYVHGTKALEWERLLEYAGLEVTPKDEQRVWLGLVPEDRRGRTVVQEVVAGSPAYKAGLNVDDEVIAFNNFRIRADEIPRRVGELKVKETLKITVFRNDKLREFEVTVEEGPVPSYSIKKTKNPSALQRSIFESWLDSLWEEQKEKKG